MFNLSIKTPAGDFRSISSVNLEKLKEKIEKTRHYPYLNHLTEPLNFVLNILCRRKSYLPGYQFDLSCFDKDKKYYEIHLDTGTGDFND